MLVKASEAKQLIEKMTTDQLIQSKREVERQTKTEQDNLDWAIRTPKSEVLHGTYRQWEDIRRNEQRIRESIANGKALLEMIDGEIARRRAA